MNTKLLKLEKLHIKYKLIEKGGVTGVSNHHSKITFFFSI